MGVVLLVGSATFGVDGIAYRLGDPTDVLPFVADTAQLVGQIAAIVGGGCLVLDLVRRRRAIEHGATSR